jgi:glycine dehydrogenase subunit 1
MGELLNMDVVGMPTYSWGTAAGHAIRMASRLTGRNEVLIARTANPERRDVIRTFCQSPDPRSRIDIRSVDYLPETGLLHVGLLGEMISSRTAAVYFENPTCLGTIESEGQEVSDLCHRHGAVSIVGVDPITLGVLAPPADYGADIVVGTAQTLGVRMNCGGGTSGFIATRDEEPYVAENPLFLISITDTTHPGEVAFGQCAYERTSYMSREKAKDWVGTVSGLWTITASVYMTLLGPRGFRDIGGAIIQKTQYAIRRLSELAGVRVLLGHQAFREFVVRFDNRRHSVREVNERLLNRGIFGGRDLSKDFPELGNSALYCVTEMHAQSDIDRLVSALQEVVSR